MSAIAPNPKIVATAIPLGQHIMLRSFGEGAIQTEAPIGNQLPGRPLAPKFRNFNTWRGRRFAVDQGTPVDAEIASSADRVLQVSPPAEPERVAPVSANRSGPVHVLVH